MTGAAAVRRTTGLSFATTQGTRWVSRVNRLLKLFLLEYRAMRRTIALIVLGTGLAGCSIPFTTSKDERKAPCDSIAAQAIQTSSLADAKTLSAQAAECYARAQGG